ncbi:TorD/DmsD family molecular chaperone, partial [Slackia sp.]
MNENTIERIGMALADRAYIYRLFHVALGAEPNAEELDVLASEQTRAVFGRLAESDVANAKRLATWDEGLKVDSMCSDALTRMVELCAVLGERQANDSAYADAMKVAFNKLFMVPGGSYVYPWESPYLGKDATLFKESTLDVRERYAKYGFEAEMKGHFPED